MGTVAFDGGWSPCRCGLAGSDEGVGNPPGKTGTRKLAYEVGRDKLVAVGLG
jgi:hypothetical protein